MHAGKTGAQAAEAASLLESFGIELSAGGLAVMTDFVKAESAYIHHSRVPVAVVAMAVGVTDLRACSPLGVRSTDRSRLGAQQDHAAAVGEC